MDSSQITMTALIKFARKVSATDIHLIAGAKITFRVNDKLISYDDFSSEVMKPHKIESFVDDILLEDQKQQLNIEKHMVIAHSIENVGRFRMSVSMQRGSYNISIKMVNTTIESIQSLEFHSVLEYLPKIKEGLILVSGGAKSGKSTTVAAVLDGINRQFSKSIVTIEHPIEYLFRHGESIIKQKEVGIDINSHLEGLKSTLREDPDVIYIDQIPDIETLQLVLNAAEQGYLIIAAVYYPDALTTIESILEAFPTEQRNRTRIQFAKVLKAVVAQQLIFNESENKKHVVFEVLLNNNAIKRLIVENKTQQIPLAMTSYRDLGMISMDESLKKMVIEGKIDKELAYHHSHNPKQFIALFN